MGYIRAEDVLPSEVLTLVQEFIDGQMLYVPKGCRTKYVGINQPDKGISGISKHADLYRIPCRLQRSSAGGEILPFRKKHSADRQNFRTLLSSEK